MPTVPTFTPAAVSFCFPFAFLANLQSGECQLFSFIFCLFLCLLSVVVFLANLQSGECQLLSRPFGSHWLLQLHLFFARRAQHTHIQYVCTWHNQWYLVHIRIHPLWFLVSAEKVRKSQGQNFTTKLSKS